jgi:exopolysaccharide production protein ExoQ
MPPSLALFLWLILTVALLRWDPARQSTTSPALWVPVIWMFILGSRLPSQWLGGAIGQQAAQALEEGNPFDRAVSSAVLLLALGILMSRSFKWGNFLACNLALTAFLSFALVSVLWSDFPFVALKRWIRDLGNYLVILVALSDRRPLEAIRTVLRRLSYLLVPLSILLIKYYPQIGKQYSFWTGDNMYVGAATSKNMLGVLCLISGLFFFWDTVTRWRELRERRTKRIILVNVAFIAMTFWLLNLSSSATSTVCLVIGCLVIAVVHNRAFQRHPGFFKGLIPVCVCVYLVLAFGFNINGQLAGTVGRDPTLTDRTKIWGILLGMHTNPLLGTGYESFWLGPRLKEVWRSFPGLNEAHNGYLDVYLNLGVIGLVLFAGFMIVSYRTICRRLSSSSSLGSLALAVWIVLAFYNMTEASFLGGLLLIVLLMGTIVVPERATGRVHRVAAFGDAGDAQQIPTLLLEMTGQRR